jgi:transcriptional regulator with XRE-family HTH domain
MDIVKTLDRRADTLLTQIRQTLGLSEAELADLFNVQRTSVIGWREHGIPEARRASVERVRDLAGVLKREMIPTRIAEIVRTPDAWLADRTILQTIRSDGAEAIYGYLRRLFAYNGSC